MNNIEIEMLSLKESLRVLERENSNMVKRFEDKEQQLNELQKALQDVPLQTLSYQVEKQSTSKTRTFMSALAGFMLGTIYENRKRIRNIPP